MSKFLFFTLSLAFAMPAIPCTRAVYLGANNETITGRTMDWKEDTGSNIWSFPRGMKRDSRITGKSFEWTAKYGSVIAAAYDIATTDGINEKGLVANILWLAESEYPKEDKKKPAMAISIWAQYVLDQFATVKEAVNELKKKNLLS